jgi:hypothetical protein
VGRDKNIGTYFIDMLRRPGGKLGGRRMARCARRRCRLGGVPQWPFDGVSIRRIWVRANPSTAQGLHSNSLAARKG